MNRKNRIPVLTAVTVMTLFGTVFCAGTAFASKLPDGTAPDGSHCDKKTWSPRGNPMVNYIFDHDYEKTDHYYQVYKAISTTPNPSFLGEPNVDTWYSTVRCS